MRIGGWVSAVVAVAAALTLTLAVSACGGDGDPSGGGVASLDGTSTNDSGAADGGSGGDDAAAAEKRREGALAFARCMRENGIDHPDPDENGMFEITPGGQSFDPESAKFREAAEACEKHLGDLGAPPELSDEEREKLEEQMLAFARCMREQGIDMPDPRFEGEGFALELPEGIDPREPDFLEAQKACRKYEPTLGGSGEARGA